MEQFLEHGAYFPVVYDTSDRYSVSEQFGSRGRWNPAQNECGY